MKLRLSFFLLVLFGQQSFAQNVDSLARANNWASDSLHLVRAEWNKKKIAKKTSLITHHFNQKDLFKANQFVAYIELRRKGNAPLISFGNEVKEKKTTSVFGKELQALAAINGTFFDVANGGSVDFIKIDGQVIKQNIPDKSGNRARHQKAAIVINDKGKLSLKKWDNTANWENNLPEKNIMLSGPMLLTGYSYEKLDTAAFTRLRNPRTAIGVKPNGNIILLTIDGRNENSAGASLHELARLMRWLGCSDAINLDGGGSTTLWTAADGVVNYPSDNKKWDHEGERKVANVIILKKK